MEDEICYYFLFCWGYMGNKGSSLGADDRQMRCKYFHFIQKSTFFCLNFLLQFPALLALHRQTLFLQSLFKIVFMLLRSHKETKILILSGILSVVRDRAVLIFRRKWKTVKLQEL